MFFIIFPLVVSFLVVVAALWGLVLVFGGLLLAINGSSSNEK